MIGCVGDRIVTYAYQEDVQDIERYTDENERRKQSLRSKDGVQERLEVGGDVVQKVPYAGAAVEESGYLSADCAVGFAHGPVCGERVDCGNKHGTADCRDHEGAYYHP